MMKRLTIVLAATVIFLALGCEKRAGQAEEADRYNADIDGPTCVLRVRADENLLKDQRKLARQVEIAAPEEPTPSEPSPTTLPTTSPATSPAPAPGPI